MILTITGASGFFGRALIKHLIQTRQIGDYQKIFLVGRNKSKFRAHSNFIDLDSFNVEFVEWDIGLSKIPSELYATSLIIHAAADSSIGPSLTPYDRFNRIINNATGLLSLLEGLPNLRRLLFVSTGGVYETNTEYNLPITESSSLISEINQVKNAYPVAKIFSEHLFTQAAIQFNFDLIIARCFTFIGEDLPHVPQYAVYDFVRQAFSNRLITIKGTGEPLRSYMYQMDLVDWLFTLLHHGKAQEIYNVGSAKPISILGLAQSITDIIGHDIRIQINGDPKFDTRINYVPSVAKANSIGLVEKHGFLYGLNKFIDNYYEAQYNNF